MPEIFNSDQGMQFISFDGIDVTDLETLQVNYKSCQRCLLCYEASQKKAISVKDYSGARKLP